MSDFVNYFGSTPHVASKKGEDAAAPAAEPFDSADGQLSFGEQVDTAAHTPSVGLRPDYTPQTLLRDAWVEVDLSAIAYNIKTVMRAVGSRRLLCADVSADAYGHGAVRVAKAALEAGADRLAVATPEEGVLLRQAGINAPILVKTQPCANAIELLVAYNLTPAVFDAKFALDYAEYADRQGKSAPFHLEVNSGMNCNGVFYLDAADFIRSVSFHRALKYEGTFTVFGICDSRDQLDFNEQCRRFEEALSQIRAAGFDPGIVHAADSYTIFKHPQLHYGMVRMGSCMYGIDADLYATSINVLKPVMSVKARVSQVTEPQVGEGVGRGYNYRVGMPVQIATVPIGYADGISPALARSGFRVLWHGMAINQVGDIGMNQMMVEIPLKYSVTGVKGSALPGDEIVIIGVQGDVVIPCETMAESLQALCPQITILFGQRLPKVYL